MQAPLKYASWVPRLSNDLLGFCFVSSEPTQTTQTVYHNNDHAFETLYTLQISPMSQLQPDLQVVWDPVSNPNAGASVVNSSFCSSGDGLDDLCATQSRFAVAACGTLVH